MLDDRRLSTVTGDFVDAAKGAFEQCDALENMIAFSYMIPLGSWEGDPDLGHRFNEIRQDTPANRLLLKEYAGAAGAVKWLVDLGVLARVDVMVESLEIGAVAFQVDYYRPQSDRPRRLGFLIPTGAG